MEIIKFLTNLIKIFFLNVKKKWAIKFYYLVFKNSEPKINKHVAHKFDLVNLLNALIKNNL